jgi:hypothetical protein
MSPELAFVMSPTPLSWIADKLDLTPRLSADYPF